MFDAGDGAREARARMRIHAPSRGKRRRVHSCERVSIGRKQALLEPQGRVLCKAVSSGILSLRLSFIQVPSCLFPLIRSVALLKYLLNYLLS